MTTTASASRVRFSRHPLSIETPAFDGAPPHQPPHIFSPVNELGSFEFDKVLKADQVAKRRRRTNIWDTVRLVLRPNVLSIYKDQQETRLRHQITLSDITAVALRKDRKRKGSHDGVFGIFSPSRNFHLEASSEAEAATWVELLRREAHIDEKDEEMIITSPNGTQSAFAGFTRPVHSRGSAYSTGIRASSDTFDNPRHASPPSRQGPQVPYRPSFDASDMSGSEAGSWPDQHANSTFGSLGDLSLPKRQGHLSSSLQSESMFDTIEARKSSAVAGQNRSDFYQVGRELDEERVIWHGYLEYLETRSGVKQWKKYWVVLRPKNLALYKSEDEYAALLILPLSSILDAVETDPVTKGKESCMQVICEDQSYRFACIDEEELSKWLGALKSTLAKRNDARARPP